MPILLIASGNAHKIKEIGAILAEAGLPLGRDGWELRGLDAYPQYQPPEEDRDSFAANAALKAGAACAMSGLISLADDSGLCVDYLQGGPGLYSARYAGTGRDADNRAKLLRELAGVAEEQRGAAFVCWACLAFPAGPGREPDLWYAQGRCPGRISFAERGEHGFGYDPLFFLPQLDCTMAQLEPERKNKLSHRYQAMARVAAELMRYQP